MEQSENFNTKIENIIKCQIEVTDMKGRITTLKILRRGLISDQVKQKEGQELEDMVVEFIQSGQQKEK